MRLRGAGRKLPRGIYYIGGFSSSGTNVTASVDMGKFRQPGVLVLCATGQRGSNAFSWVSATVAGNAATLGPDIGNGGNQCRAANFYYPVTAGGVVSVSLTANQSLTYIGFFAYVLLGVGSTPVSQGTSSGGGASDSFTLNVQQDDLIVAASIQPSSGSTSWTGLTLRDELTASTCADGQAPSTDPAYTITTFYASSPSRAAAAGTAWR